ncbi:hypothetical protein FRC14_005058 [Serendipita sp. 396]|nr:hypothetical protein FRC14_005058 [Serendipita sp. 396]
MSEWGMDRSQPSSITLDIKLPSSSPVSQPQNTSSRSVFEPFQLQITIQIPSIRNSSQVIQTTVPYIDLPPTPPVCLPVQDEAQQREIELRDTLNKRKPTHISANITSRAGNLPTPASTSQPESPVEDGPMDNSSDTTRQNSVVGRERIHHGITNDIDYRDSSYFRHQRNSTSDDKSPLAWRDEDADHKARNAPQNDSQDLVPFQELLSALLVEVAKGGGHFLATHPGPAIVRRAHKGIDLPERREINHRMHNTRHPEAIAAILMNLKAQRNSRIIQ